MLVAYSAKDGTTANDGDGRNSPFTTALLHNIETPGLEVTFMFRAVRDEVMDATNREQQPFVYGSLSSQAIYFKPPAQTGGSPPPATSNAAAQAWDAVKNSNDPAALESFLRYYGDGFYGDLARARLADLKNKTLTASLPPQRALTAEDGDSSAQFGGPPYCRYSVTLKSPRTAVQGRLVGTLTVRRSDQTGNLGWRVVFNLK